MNECCLTRHTKQQKKHSCHHGIDSVREITHRVARSRWFRCGDWDEAGDCHITGDWHVSGDWLLAGHWTHLLLPSQSETERQVVGVVEDVGVSVVSVL